MRSIVFGLCAVLLSLTVVGCGGGGKTESHGQSGANLHAQTTQTNANVDLPSPAEVQSYYAFGHPAGEVERRAIVPLVKRYYAAVAAGDGAAACSMQYADFARAVPEDIEQGPEPVSRRPKHCAPIMTRFFKRHRGQPTVDLGAIEVTSLRIEGGQGIALLRSPKMRSGEIVLHREGSKWKVQDLIGKYLP